MTDTALSAIVGGIAGIITGGVSSLLAPWATWGIEKQKQKLQQRRDLISTWRAMIKAVHEGVPPEFPNGRSPYLGDILIKYDWATLKPHLTPDALEHFRNRWSGYYYGIQGGEEVDLLTDEVGRIEKEWKLV